MSTALAPTYGGNMLRQSINSMEYVASMKEIADANGELPVRTAAEKKAKLALILSDEVSGFKRLGQGMIGPIQLHLRYQGLVRNVLLEDNIAQGDSAEYEVLDDLGQAYVMNGTDGEVRITPFEGKRVRAEFFRIASQPAIRKEDLTAMKVDAVEYLQDETKQAILKQEDARLMLLLLGAITDYGTRADNPTPGAQNVVIASGGLTPQAFYAAVTMTDLREVPSDRILINPADLRDLYMFGTGDTGWAFKDRVVAGEKITSYGEFQIQSSIMVPKGKMFLLPDPKYLGVMPIRYSLDVEENHQVEAFWRGWVFDEMLSMLVLNPRGIASVTKSTYMA